MGTFKVISRKTKEQVIQRIKQDGISVSQVALEFGISTKSVYRWLSEGIIAEPGILEINKLKRENQFLLNLIGRLTAEKEKGKKT